MLRVGDQPSSGFKPSLESGFSDGGVERFRPTVVHPYFNRRLGGSLLQASVDFGAGASQAARTPSASSEATKRGLRYERRVLRSFSAAHGCRFVAQLPFSFQTCAKRGRAIPDGLLLSEAGDAVCIVEVKLHHCADAWQQLTQFYLPIVREALAPLRVCCLEVCSSYDPWVKLPGPVRLLADPSEAFETREGFAVLVTRKGDLRCPTSSTAGQELATLQSQPQLPALT